jgi:hypothetical protein
MIEKVFRPVKDIIEYCRLPAVAWLEHQRDRLGLHENDSGPVQIIEKGIEWLCYAQDNSTSKDGGVARHFSLINGWSPSYPETTGYIIPTMFKYAEINNDHEIRNRIKRMIDWLVSIQYPHGGFPGGMIGQKPIVPVVFNTGQILLGLVSAVKEFGDEYRESMNRAAKWLVKNQERNGSWRKYPTPFAIPGEKTYDTHVAWGLFEASRLEKGENYSEAAMANIQWALSLQHKNGWFDNCCLTNSKKPLTHTLGYVLRGILEGYRFTEDSKLLINCIKTADGILNSMRFEDGFLPGRINSKWRGTESWVCLTGTAQIAFCWFILFQLTGDERYRKAALRANRFVRRTIKVNSLPETRGAVKGSFPVWGGYGAYEYLSWACKFMIDSNMLEREIME